MGNNTSIIYAEQMKTIHDKLHKPEPNLYYDPAIVERITRLPATELRELLLTSSDLTLTEVFRIFHYRKLIENNEHQAFTDVLYAEPLKRAQEIQERLDVHSVDPSDLPLLGFVMSIKESLRVKGTVSTSGLAINVGFVHDTQPDTIKLLIQKGALITCKGNVPQALFAIETINNIFGTTKNLYNKDRSAGGSSGGEATLIALKCVNAAIGSDIGGSLRIPALFCGIVSLKPTVNRISNDLSGGFYDSHEFSKTMPSGTGIIQPTVGPMASNVGDCERLMQVLIESTSFNRYVPPLPWRKVELPTKVGLFVEFDQFEIAPSHKRALRIAADVLEQHGISIIPLNFDIFYEDILILTLASFYKDDGVKKTFGCGSPIKEPLIAPSKEFSKVLCMPHFLVRYFANKETDDRRIIFCKALVKSRAINTYTLACEIGALYKKFTQYLKEKGVQLMLAPGMATPAIYHGSSNENNLQIVYMAMFNLFDFPAGALPVTRVRSDEEYYETKYNDVVAHSMHKNIKNSEGLPVGIQVAALPWMEEHVISVMKLIETNVHYK